jgi:hypothetical protein
MEKIADFFIPPDYSLWEIFLEGEYRYLEVKLNNPGSA